MYHNCSLEMRYITEYDAKYENVSAPIHMPRLQRLLVSRAFLVGGLNIN